MTSGTHPALRLWPDNPTAVDLLGFADIAAPVLEAIRRERLDPVAVGIFGDWGCGKTTVLEILEAQLRDAEDTIVVYTRPWEYDPTTDAKSTLIAEVLNRVRDETARREGGWEKLSDTVKGAFMSLARRVQVAKAVKLAANSVLTMGLPTIDAVIDLFSDKSKEAAIAEPTLEGFRVEFGKLMAALEDIRRVVVLVDDLDRCLPEPVVMTLEAIKLFLSVEKMAFVIAADEVLVRAAIARRYDASQVGTRMAGDYLEKIVQIPITVPALGQGDTEAYLAMMLLDQHANDDGASLSTIAAHCAEQRHRGEPQVLADLPAGLVPTGAEDDLALAAELAPVLCEQLDGNPRRLKRFLNAFWVRSDIATRRGITLSPPVLAKLMVLERIEEDAFGQLLDWLAAGALADELRQLEQRPGTGSSAHSAFAWWAAMPPQLAGTDLGPYLRLAASLRRRSGLRGDLRADLAELLEQLATGSTADRSRAQKRLKELPESDRRVMSREITERMRTNPDSQEHLAEALDDLLADPAACADVLDGLRRLDPSRVDAALIITIGADGVISDDIRGLVRGWRESQRLQDIAQNAADDLLGSQT